MLVVALETKRLMMLPGEKAMQLFPKYVAYSLYCFEKHRRSDSYSMYYFFSTARLKFPIFHYFYILFLGDGNQINQWRNYTSNLPELAVGQNLYRAIFGTTKPRCYATPTQTFAQRLAGECGVDSRNFCSFQNHCF